MVNRSVLQNTPFAMRYFRQGVLDLYLILCVAWEKSYINKDFFPL